MSVIVSNGATNLSTASGFYRAEAYNLGFFNSTSLVLTTTRVINATFANAGNCQGIIIAIGTSNSNKDVTVTLKESGTVRATKTLTSSAICNGTSSPIGGWIVPFEFATPYAVDTVAGKWTFEVSQGAGTGDWVTHTSNGTLLGYAAWCDNAVTFANNDSVICKDQVTVTQSATVNGVLGTGDSLRGVAFLVCKASTPPTKTNNAVNLQIQNTTAITLSIGGLIVYGSHSGFQAGTSTTPIAAANPLKMIFRNAPTGWVGIFGVGPYHAQRGTFLMYGEVPAVRSYTYTADVALGGSSFSTASTTGINTGDQFWLSGIDHYSNNDFRYYTVTGTTPTTVSVTPNISTFKRLSGWKAYKVNGYGIDFSYKLPSTAQFFPSFASNFYFTGVRLWVTDDSPGNTFFFTGSALGQSGEDIAYRSQYEVYRCVRGISSYPLVQGSTPYEGIKMSESYGFASQINASAMNQIDDWPTIGVIEESNNFNSNGGGKQAGSNGYPTWKIENNIYEICGQGYWRGKDSIYRNNYIKGGSGGGWQIEVGDFLNCIDWSNNTWHSAPTGVSLYNTVLNVVMKNEKRLYGLGLANYSHLLPKPGSAQIGVIMQDPDFDVVVTASSRPLIINGSRLAVVNNNASANSFSYLPFGTITKTGAGLVDTTVRTAGGFGMRFEPVNSTKLLSWSQNIPTGNIQNKTMSVSVWVKLNNAAYWAGTNTMPILTINYDNGTLATAVAQQHTNWQRLDVVITPTTTYGQIEMKVTGATDATGTNRYFYVDDVNVAYPAGVAIDLGNLDLWAEGLPIAPAIATMPSLGGVWDEPLSAHTIAGSAGKILKDAADDADTAANR